MTPERIQRYFKATLKILQVSRTIRRGRRSAACPGILEPAPRTRAHASDCFRRPRGCYELDQKRLRNAGEGPPEGIGADGPRGRSYYAPGRFRIFHRPPEGATPQPPSGCSLGHAGAARVVGQIAVSRLASDKHLRHSLWLLHHQRWRRLLTGLDDRNGPVGHSGDRAPYAHREYRGCRGSRRHGCLSSLRSIELPYRSQLRGGRLVAFLVSGV
jgi:hypothetical protein